MKKLFSTIKKVIASYRKRRDDRFRERIDRVYFRHNGDGLRYIDGHLVAVKDEKTGQEGNFVAGAYLTHSDALSTRNCSDPQAGNGRKHLEPPKHR